VCTGVHAAVLDQAGVGSQQWGCKVLLEACSAFALEASLSGHQAGICVLLLLWLVYGGQVRSVARKAAALREAEKALKAAEAAKAKKEEQLTKAKDAQVICEGASCLVHATCKVQSSLPALMVAHSELVHLSGILDNLLCNCGLQVKAEEAAAAAAEAEAAAAAAAAAEAEEQGADEAGEEAAE